MHSKIRELLISEDEASITLAISIILADVDKYIHLFDGRISTYGPTIKKPINLGNYNVWIARDKKYCIVSFFTDELILTTFEKYDKYFHGYIDKTIQL